MSLLASVLAKPQPAPVEALLDKRAGPNAALTVYNLADCVGTGTGVQYKLYTLQNGVCLNTPPGIDTTAIGIPYLSYRVLVINGTPAGQNCFLTSFAAKDCKGNYQGIIIEGGNPTPCRNVLIGGAGTPPSVGARSSRLDCVPK